MTALIAVAALLLLLVVFARWIRRQIWVSNRQQIREATDTVISRHVMEAPSPDADRFGLLLRARDQVTV